MIDDPDFEWLMIDASHCPHAAGAKGGTTADWTQAVALIDGIAAQFLLADRGYDSNEILDKAIETGCEIVITLSKGIVRHSAAM